MLNVPEIAANSTAARSAASNARFASACWGVAWDAIVAPAPDAPPNELAAGPIPPETEALVEQLVKAAAAQASAKVGESTI